MFLVSISVLSAAGQACCALGDRPITFGGQTNIILFDRARGIEHFVRQARFHSNAESLGFIAPTPSQPQLAEVEPELFSWLSTYIASQKRKGMSRSRPGGGSSGGAARILAIQEVAGYEATSLKASDSQGMTKWLKENGYHMDEHVAEWVKHYVEKDWVLTAFKVKKNSDGELRTGLVRVSFKTDQPYNPYYVPSSNRGKHPSRLSVLTIDSEDLRDETKSLSRGFSCMFPEHERATIAKHFALTTNDLPKGPLLMQQWYDDEFPRENAPDIFFTPKEDWSLSWMR